MAVYLSLISSGVFELAGPRASRRLPPAIATWLLSVGGAISATAGVTAVALLAFTLVGQSPALATTGHWSDATLNHADPVATPIAVVAAVVLTVMFLRFVVTVVRRAMAIRDAFQLARDLPGTSELAVIDSPGHDACAVPGRPGRIIMSTGMLRSLDAAERRAVLAHERSHLAHHHYLHVSLARLAAAANPLLVLLPDAQTLAAERWADEDAAGVARREIVAAALTELAAGRRSLAMPTVALGAAVGEITERVAALRRPAPPLAAWCLVMVITLLSATAATALEAAHDTERLFELAQQAYRIGHG